MIVFLLHLAGAAALLIWAVRISRTGVEHAFMAPMRLLLLGTVLFLRSRARSLRQVLNLHLGFNLALVLVGLVVATPVMAAMAALLPDRAAWAVRNGASALDPKALAEPERALACVGRETLRMGEQVAAMLAPPLQLYRGWNEDTAADTRRIEDDVDRVHFEIKLYVAHLQEGPLSAARARRAMGLVTIANNSEVGWHDRRHTCLSPSRR